MRLSTVHHFVSFLYPSLPRAVSGSDASCFSDTVALCLLLEQTKMHSVKKHIGKFMKSSEDENQISILLTDFEHASKLLASVRTLPKKKKKKALRLQ